MPQQWIYSAAPLLADADLQSKILGKAKYRQQISKKCNTYD
jgi:hypothetical protein